MDQLQTRLDALEQQMHTVNRRLRWWRGLACGLLALAVLTWALPLSTAQEGARSGEKGLAQRVAALEDLLKHFSREKNEVFITGANLHIVNGLGQTDCGPEEEPIPDCPSGDFSVVSGGSGSTASGNFSTVSGGAGSTASGNFSAVSGGRNRTAAGQFDWVAGSLFEDE
jgi:hypothetical protein